MLLRRSPQAGWGEEVRGAAAPRARTGANRRRGVRGDIAVSSEILAPSSLGCRPPVRSDLGETHPSSPHKERALGSKGRRPRAVPGEERRRRTWGYSGPGPEPEGEGRRTDRKGTCLLSELRAGPGPRSTSMGHPCVTPMRQDAKSTLLHPCTRSGGHGLGWTRGRATVRTGPHYPAAHPSPRGTAGPTLKRPYLTLRGSTCTSLDVHPDSCHQSYHSFHQSFQLALGLSER